MAGNPFFRRGAPLNFLLFLDLLKAMGWSVTIPIGSRRAYEKNPGITALL